MTTRLRIVLSSPGEVAAEQAVLKEVIDDLNRGVAKDRDLVLELCHWKKDAHPGVNQGGPQGLINPILDIPNSHIFVGIFWRRFGTPTPNALSGTEDEYRTALKSWEATERPEIMMFFKKACFEDPSEEESLQYDRVRRFRKKIEGQKVLAWPVEDTADFERQVRESLTNFIRSRYPLAGAVQAGAYDRPSNPADEARHDYCRNVRQNFASIHLFGPKRRSQWGDPDSLERMTRMEQGFVPLHLRDWGEDGGEGAPLDSEALFLTDAPEPPRFLVRGLPGSGKTTLLRHLAHRMASLTLAGDGKWVPVYARLREFKLRNFESQRTALEEWLRQEMKSLSGDSAVHDTLCTKDCFLDRPMMLLLDGLDEIEDEETRGQMPELLHVLARKNPFCRIVVTSRPIGLDRRDYPKYRPLVLEPLTAGMIEDYLARWFGDVADKIARLQAAFSDKPRILSLARNPFLLSMICYTFEKRGAAESIERRSQLYGYCTEALLERAYDPEGPRGRSIDPKATRNILKEIALRFFLWQEADFDLDHVKVMARRLPVAVAGDETAALLRRLERDTGLLQQGTEGFTFVHRTLWEYFTALALRGKNDPQFVIRQAANPEWEEVVRLYAGLLEDVGREQDLVHRLWTINRPLALRVTTETQTPAAELLADLIEGKADNREKLLLIGALEQSLEMVDADEGRNLVEETLRILLIDCGEQDCEAVFQAQVLLEKKGCRPPLQPGGIIHELLDLGQAPARQKTLLDDPTNLFEWVTVQGGSFQIGNDQHDADERPAHPVTVATFQMARHPVTNGLVSAAAADFPFGAMIHDFGEERNPAVGNTWFEAYYFALWAGARLLSEAEWEYAARGGPKARPTRYFFGDDPEDLADYAWFGDTIRRTAHPVDEVNQRTGNENTNPLGLANILGNVWDWVADDWHNDYEDAPNDGQPWIETPRGANRVIRGGGWRSGAYECRSAARNFLAPVNRRPDIGFRLAKSVLLGS